MQCVPFGILLTFGSSFRVACAFSWLLGSTSSEVASLEQLQDKVRALTEKLTALNSSSQSYRQTAAVAVALCSGNSGVWLCNVVCLLKKLAACVL